MVQAGARLVPRRNGRLLRKWVPPFLEPLRAGPTRAGGTDGRGGGVHLQTVKTSPPEGGFPDATRPFVERQKSLFPDRLKVSCLSRGRPPAGAA